MRHSCACHRRGLGYGKVFFCCGRTCSTRVVSLSLRLHFTDECLCALERGVPFIVRFSTPVARARQRLVASHLGGLREPRARAIEFTAHARPSAICRWYVFRCFVPQSSNPMNLSPVLFTSSSARVDATYKSASSWCMYCVDACSLATCAHSGTCVLQGPTDFTCQCETGWTGTLCEQGLRFHACTHTKLDIFNPCARYA